MAGAEMTTFLRACLEMLLRVRALREQTGRLDRDVHPELAPREVGGVTLGDELDLVPVHADRVVARLDRHREIPEHRVVLEQVRHRLRVADVVRGHDLEVTAVLELGTQEVPADAAEAVDPHPCLGHLGSPSLRLPIESNRDGRREIRSSPQCFSGFAAARAGGPGSSEDDPPGPSPARDLTADGV